MAYKALCDTRPRELPAFRSYLSAHGAVPQTPHRGCTLRAFALAGASAWNVLPPDTHMDGSLTSSGLCSKVTRSEKLPQPPSFKQHTHLPVTLLPIFTVFNISRHRYLLVGYITLLLLDCGLDRGRGIIVSVHYCVHSPGTAPGKHQTSTHTCSMKEGTPGPTPAPGSVPTPRSGKERSHHGPGLCLLPSEMSLQPGQLLPRELHKQSYTDELCKRRFPKTSMRGLGQSQGVIRRRGVGQGRRKDLDYF